MSLTCITPFMTFPETEQLRIGFVGAGFIANFHLDSLLAVRNVRVAGVYGPSLSRRDALAHKADDLSLGPCRAFASIEAMLGSGEVDALWIVAPNHVRLEIMRDIRDLVKAGKSGALRAVACEKPLARSLSEAKEMLSLVTDAGLLHGYLENQLFMPAVQRGRQIIWRRAVPESGRPYIARASEEHSGPHEPWFWQGDKQGGGALLDMMCHCVEVGRFLLPQLRAFYPSLLSELRDRGYNIALDTGWPPEGWTPAARREVAGWIAQCDHLLVNETELLHLTSESDLNRAISAVEPLLRADATLVVKLGANGALGRQGGAACSAMAPEVAPFDTIGAGDSFNAGYLHARLSGCDLTTSLDAGCTVASSIISRFPRHAILPGELASAVP